MKHLLFASIVTAAALSAQQDPEFEQWKRRSQMEQMERNHARAGYERGRERAGLTDTPEKLELRRREAEFEQRILAAHDAWAEWMKTRAKTDRDTTDVRQINLEAKAFAAMVEAMKALAGATGRPGTTK